MPSVLLGAKMPSVLLGAKMPSVLLGAKMPSAFLGAARRCQVLPGALLQSDNGLDFCFDIYQYVSSSKRQGRKSNCFAGIPKDLPNAITSCQVAGSVLTRNNFFFKATINSSSR